MNTVISVIYICQLYYILFICNFTPHGICINFGNQHIYYLINLYFFVACAGQPKPLLTRYLGTMSGFQNYKLLDFILLCGLFSSIVQLKVKHQLLHNYSFDDGTSMKILGFQRDTVNMKNSLIHQRNLPLYFLIHPKNTCNIRRIVMEHSGIIHIINIPGTFFLEYSPEFHK